MSQALLNQFCTSKQAAAILGQTPQYVAKLCSEGKWGAFKFGKEYLIPRKAIQPLPYREHNPDDQARDWRERLANYIALKELDLSVLAVLASGDTASKVYAKFLKDACDSVGIKLKLVELDPSTVKRTITKANTDPSIHGIFVFYPIFRDDRDAELKNLITPSKDIEGLSSPWMDRLYANVRHVDEGKTKKAVLPCTPLAILKILEYVTSPPYLDLRDALRGKRVVIFNRSSLVGKPLAHMLLNDGAEAFAFDVHGGVKVAKKGAKEKPITRAEALAQADIVVTGVPSRDFEVIRAEEIRPKTICLNFSFVPNFHENAKKKSGIYVPRVGPMTVAMCLRNVVRLHDNYKEQYARA